MAAREPVKYPEAADATRRRDPATDDSPETVPSPDQDLRLPERPSEDGGIAQHPVHDDDIEDMDAEDFEEQVDEVAEVGIKPID